MSEEKRREIVKKANDARTRLRAMSDALYVACETWDVSGAARLAWLYAHHPALAEFEDVGNSFVRFEPAALAQLLKFVEDTNTGVENYSDCFKPGSGFHRKNEDEIWEEAQKLGRVSQEAFVALLDLVDAWRDAFQIAERR